MGVWSSKDHIISCKMASVMQEKKSSEPTEAMLLSVAVHMEKRQRKAGKKDGGRGSISHHEH